MQGGCGKARGVALGTDENDPDLVVHGFRDPGDGRWVEPPFEDGTVYHQRARDAAAGGALFRSSRVDQQGPSALFGSGLLRSQPSETAPRFLEKPVDGE